jgi:hypothetical protein
LTQRRFQKAAPDPRGLFVPPNRCLNFQRAKIVLATRRAEHVLRFVRSIPGKTQETMMSFSMTSYFLGVGTVVGALAMGFGGGVVLTKTAMKDSSTGPSRIERAARSESAPAAPQITEAKAVPVPRADPSPEVQPVAAPAPQVQDSQVQAAAESRPAVNAEPVADPAKPEPARVAEPVRQIETSRPTEQPVRQGDAPRQIEQPVRQADAPKQAEQPTRQSEARRVEQKEAEHRAAEREQQRKAEQRKAERDKRIAERERSRARTMVVVRRQRPLEEQEQPPQPELAFQREESQPGLFEGLFGRPAGESRD